MKKTIRVRRLTTAIAVLASLGVFALITNGQTRRRPGTQPRTRPTAAATPTPTPAPAATPTSELIAMVNGVAIRMADIEAEVAELISQDQDPYLRSFYEDPVKETAAARSRALEARINSLLIATEARKQRKTVEEFRELEITSRIPTPTDQEVQEVYQANHAAFGSASLAEVRPQIINFLRSQRMEALYSNLANRLRMTNLVTRGADVNASGLAPGAVVATVGGTPINAASIDERMKSYLFKLRSRIFEIRKMILDRKINDTLLTAEATKRNIRPEDIVRLEITDKRKPPTEAEIRKFFDENKERINGDFASTHDEISRYLEAQEQEKLEKALADRVRGAANLRIMLTEPEPPVQNVSRDDDPARGDKNASVTVIEFTDFQCPACGAMYPLLEEVLRSYGNSVHFVVRDFPLAMHPDSRKAAEAANAAHAQGKFFEYTALLFQNQKALDDASLKKYASAVGLDRKRFDTELDNGTYAAEVQHDVEDGEMYGVDSTPAIFVNGVMLRDFTAEGIRALIDRAMRKPAQTAKP